VASRTLAHLERRIYKREVNEDYQRIKAELDEAMRLQSLLLPPQAALDNIRTSCQLDIAFRYHPCSELGGDMVSVYQLDEHRVMVMMADICQHGVRAAMYAFSLNALYTNILQSPASPGTMLEALNARLYPIIDRGTFATMFLGVIDTKKQQLDYAVAAPPAPILCTKDGAKHLENQGYLLGTKEDASYPTYSVPYYPGSRLCLYSDGLTDMPYRQGVTDPEQQLAALVEASAGHSAQAAVDEAYDTMIPDHSSLHDDVSCLICQFQE
jgi:sigma-B regulation protein RsbU (phosphoserine phosphatase)